MNLIKVAIVEDNPPLREGLMQLINGTSGFKCVGVMPDAADILYQIRRIEPDVVLMDIDLPSKMDGIQSTFEIKEAFPDISILILTVFEDKLKIFQALKAGASGYLLKHTPPSKLLEAIAEIATGGAPMSPTVAHIVIKMLQDAPIASPFDVAQLAKLTERQKEILKSIVKGKSYKMIAEEHFISVDAVKFHVKNIYERLRVQSRHELVALVNS